MASRDRKTVNEDVTATSRVPAPRMSSRQAALLALQRTAGNRATCELLGRGGPPADQAAPASASPALGLRDRMRAADAPRPTVQRDIRLNQDGINGRFIADFTKHNAAVAGDRASEDGIVKFRPGRRAPLSDSIKFVQIVKTTDVRGTTGVAAGADADWARLAAGEEDRNKMRTTGAAKGERAGFFVDQIVADLAPTAAAKGKVAPYYDVSGAPVAGNQTGFKTPNSYRSAILRDEPGTPEELKFEFEAAAKDTKKGFWYGTVKWGFETFKDAGGITKIKGENATREEGHTPTMDAALNAFDDYWKSKGAVTNPTNRGTP